MALAFFIWGLALVLLCSVSWLFDFGVLGVVIAVASWFVTIGYTFKFFTIWTAKTEANVTVDALRKDKEGKGVLTVHLPGLSWKRPTEVNSSDPIYLGSVTQSCIAACPTKDGPEIKFPVTFKWQPRTNIENLERFLLIRKDPSIINTHAVNMVQGTLSRAIIAMSVEEAETKTADFQQLIDDTFNKMRDIKDTSVPSLEEEFGIDISTPVVGPITHDPELQVARTTRETMGHLRESAAALVKEAKDAGQALEMADAMDRVLTVHRKGNVSQHTQKVQGKNFGEQLAAFLLAAFGGTRQEPNRPPKGGKP